MFKHATIPNTTCPLILSIAYLYQLINSINGHKMCCLYLHMVEEFAIYIIRFLESKTKFQYWSHALDTQKDSVPILQITSIHPYSFVEGRELLADLDTFVKLYSKSSYQMLIDLSLLTYSKCSYSRYSPEITITFRQQMILHNCNLVNQFH